MHCICLQTYSKILISNTKKDEKEDRSRKLEDVP
jgi:hypothetical protein